MKKLLMVLMVSSLVLVVGCGPTFVRDTDVEGLDNDAMSTGLDRSDLDRLFAENLESLFSSGVAKSWQGGQGGEGATLAIERFNNETSEHIDSQLDALLSKLQTQLINWGEVTVLEDPNKAQYIVSGKAYDAAEKTSDARRVQYFLFMQVIDTKTGAIRWQNEAALTKALLN